MSVAGNLYRGKARLWVALAIFSVLMLSPTAVIQVKQSQLIHQLTNTQYDSITWQFFQLEREHVKLLRMLDRALEGKALPSADEFVELYEIYVSRVNLIKEHQRTDLIDRSPVYVKLLSELDAIIALADPVFAQPEGLLSKVRELEDVSRSLWEVEPTLREMSREASRATSLYLDERNFQIREQARALTVLTVLQVLLLLCLLVLLVRHIKRQDLQYALLKNLSDDLESARLEAEHANQAKSVFLANMSHEIRTPFQGLMGMLNLLNTTTLNGVQRDHVQTALDSAQHLLGVLNDILDISTIESGELKLLMSPLDLEDLVDNTQELMRHAAIEKAVDLRFEYGERLPKWVRGDAMRIRQILFNLIGNAIKFTDHGEIKVSVDLRPGSNGNVSIVIEDTGNGMDDATLDRLFTRFYQADNSFLRKTGGTGLGLEISRSLARLMGGDITVTSKVGIGSRFEVTLDLPEATAPTPSRDDVKVESASYQRLRLLVAEDHSINLKYMNLLLDKMGHDAVFCGNGLEALDLLQQQSFDAVLLDYHMPELDGISTAQAIRKMGGVSSHIKIMLVTADVVGEIKSRAEEAGVDCFVSKPLTLHDLNQALLSCGLLIPEAPKGNELSDPSDLTALLQSLDAQFPLAVDLVAYQQLVPFATREVRAEMVALVLAPQSGSLDVLVNAMTAGDQPAIERAAHNLKGAGMLLGLSSLVRAATEIESTATQLNSGDAAQWKAKLRHLGERSKNEISQWEMSVKETPLPVEPNR